MYQAFTEFMESLEICGNKLKKTLEESEMSDRDRIGSLTTEHKASYSLVFSDIKYRQNIAGR